MADRKTIGLTDNGRAALDRLMIAIPFKEQMDAAKVALAIAISSGRGEGDATGVQTTWNVGSFDPDGSVRMLLETLLPGCDPYSCAEYLIDQGLRLIDRVMDGQLLTLSQLLSLTE